MWVEFFDFFKKKGGELDFNFLIDVDQFTGWSISFLYTLTGWYDKNNAHTKKIMVDLFSVYPDISFHSKKSEKITDISFHNRNNRIHKLQ